MKRWLFAAAAVLSCTLVFGQGSASVVVGNQEDVPFYYVLDPPQLAGLSSGSPLLTSKVAAYFSAADAGLSFASVQPQGESRLMGLSEGPHLLLGFFVPPDVDDFPVRVMTIQADTTGERFYAVYATPAQLNVHRGVGKLAQFAGSAAGTQAAAAAATQTGSGQAGSGTDSGTQAASSAQTTSGAQGSAAQGPTGQGDTEAAAGAAADTAPSTEVPTLASFSAYYDPVVFTRETAGNFEVLPISDSRAWRQTGTRIASVRGSLDSLGLRLQLDVPDGFSPSVSYFLYVFDTRSAGRDNALTLEIEPMARGSRGVCILWGKGNEPRLLGSVTTTAASVQLDVGAADLQALAPAGAAPTVDLTAGWYDKGLGMWEEFYYTTLSATR